MADGQTPAAAQGGAGRMVGEWFWRFLAAAMMVAVGWVAWIVYQLNPPPLATQAAYEAAARARANQTASGLIGMWPGAEPVRPEGAMAQPGAGVAQQAAQSSNPPVNVEKLRLLDTIGAPPLEQQDTK